jgi:hypothetical protein
MREEYLALRRAHAAVKLAQAVHGCTAVFLHVWLYWSRMLLPAAISDCGSGVCGRVL